MRLVFATQNPGKLKEVQAIFADLPVEILGSRYVGVHDAAQEDGETLEENAIKKAKFVFEKTGEWSFADDTGFFIAALDDRPGIHAARWAGENATQQELLEHTLKEVKESGSDNKDAYFGVAVALIGPDNFTKIFTGKLEGKIVDEPRGEMRPHLPYDQLFVPKGKDQTFAEMSQEQKNEISHRRQAFDKLKNFLHQNYNL